MAKVIAKDNENLDIMLKRFKAQVKKQGILDDCKKHEFFVKKSIKRKEKSKRAMILNKRTNKTSR